MMDNGNAIRDQLREARARREEASARLDKEHGALKAATVEAVRAGVPKNEAAGLAGVTRQAVYDWLHVQ